MADDQGDAAAPQSGKIGTEGDLRNPGRPPIVGPVAGKIGTEGEIREPREPMPPAEHDE
jgi:hypothetical protein